MASADDIPLTSLSLTHVYYNAADPVSYVCAWLALVPQGLCVAYVTLIWASREIEIILMFLGQMGCEALNFLLKRLIKEERPKQMNGKGYGMPSSHAQFATFFAISLSLFLLLRHIPEPKPESSFTSPHRPLSYTERVILSLAAVISAASVGLSRVYLNYHTPRQVLVGSAAGAVSAVCWYLITRYLRNSGWVDYILDREEAKIFRIKDLVPEEDLVVAGWLRWQAKRGKRGQGTGLKSS